jgi:hypothetical protein
MDPTAFNTCPQLSLVAMEAAMVTGGGEKSIDEKALNRL